MDGSAAGCESRDLVAPDDRTDGDAKAAVAAMMRASRAIAEAAEVLAQESKRIVEVSREAADLEVAAARRASQRPMEHRIERSSHDRQREPAQRPATARALVTLVAGALVVAMVGVVAVVALKTGEVRLPAVAVPSPPTLAAPLPASPPMPQLMPPTMQAAPARPAVPEPPVILRREPIPQQFLPQGAPQ